jgi:hypothetical protein
MLPPGRHASRTVGFRVAASLKGHDFPLPDNKISRPENIILETNYFHWRKIKNDQS